MIERLGDCALVCIMQKVGHSIFFQLTIFPWWIQLPPLRFIKRFFWMFAHLGFCFQLSCYIYLCLFIREKVILKQLFTILNPFYAQLVKNSSLKALNSSSGENISLITHTSACKTQTGSSGVTNSFFPPCR